MHFGDVDMLLGVRRNGTAQATDDCMLYKIQKNQLSEILEDFPSIKKKLFNKAIIDNKNLIRDRLEVLKKNPMYGLKHKQKEAFENIKQISQSI